MKITEITPPQERKFTLELSESELWQLRAILSVLDGGMLGETSAWDEINAALEITPDIKDKWYLTVSDGHSNIVRVSELWIDIEAGVKA